MVANILNWISGLFQNLFAVGLGFLSNLFGWLFNALVAVLKALFQPLLIVVALIFYFIYKLGELIVMLVLVLVAIGKLLFSFVMGLFRTLSGLVWTSPAPDHGAWSHPIRQVFDALEPYQLDKVAYVMSFAIWIMTAYGVIRTLSGGRGSDD